jgi:hypothetical protein
VAGVVLLALIINIDGVMACQHLYVRKSAIDDAVSVAEDHERDSEVDLLQSRPR